jgi:hypothetical protein
MLKMLTVITERVKDIAGELLAELGGWNDAHRKTGSEP